MHLRLLTACLVPLALLSGCRSAPSVLPAARPLGPYAASVEVGGLVFLSGQIGAERDGSFEDEASSAIDRVGAELARLRLDLEDCVHVTVYLTDMDDYDAFNGIYATRLSAPYPARSCVEVTALPGGARVELEAVAARR